MFDAHYDLLTILYFNLKENNVVANKEKLIKELQKIYRTGNIDGGIINLYFMSPEEMKEELGIDEKECNNVKQMFKRSVQLLEEMKEEKIISKDKRFIYSIEGCDYISSPDELYDLYMMGLRSILPVWNNQNKYGSGNKTNYGLTYIGKQLVNFAISLGIAIDVSHANEATFNDIMDIVEERMLKGDDPVVMASHSNARTICDRKRNLTDEQILRLKKSNGYLGLFSNGNFVSMENEKLSKEERKKNFLNMLSYVVDTLEYPKDRILLSTDDMNFSPDFSYHGLETFTLDSLKDETKATLSEKYDSETIKMFMENNFISLYNRLYGIKYVDNRKPRKKKIDISRLI